MCLSLFFSSPALLSTLLTILFTQYSLFMIAPVLLMSRMADNRIEGQMKTGERWINPEIF